MKDDVDKAIEADVKNAFVLISEALTEDADSEAILLGKNELDYLGRQFDTITAEVELLREENKLLISDSCDDDAAIRDLVRPFLGDKATDGDSYDTPDNVTLVEDIVHNVAVRDRALYDLLKPCYKDSSNEALANIMAHVVEQAESEMEGGE